MRRTRLKAPQTHPLAYYHCVSRVVNREFVLGEEEKAQFCRYMRLYEELYGLRVISYCLMSNHFHILVEVPQRPEEEDLPNDEELIARVQKCLGEKAATDLRWELERFRGQGNDHTAEELRQNWFARMWNVSTFMKVLKQRFTQWFNRRHQRRGTLWEERFKSVLVEGKGPALRAMAAYIDLNPVRAGICQDPKDYRCYTYGEAIGGGKTSKNAGKSRKSIAWLGSFRGSIAGTSREVETVPKAESLRRLRCFLFGLPESESAQNEERAKEKVGRRPNCFVGGFRVKRP